MNPLRLAILVFALGPSIARAASDEKKEEKITLSPFTDTYYWHEFTLTKEAPLSEDGRYRLVKVRKSGEVEMIDCAVSDVARKFVIAKPAPKKFKKGEPLPTVIVVDSDAERQTARLKDLRVK